jgi:hypothetical protein
MSESWIKVRTVLPSDGRLRIASRKCHASTVTVFGALVTLWCLADAHADENGVVVGYTNDDINDLVGIENFCESLPEQWIDLAGEFVKLPNYQEHNGSTGKSRAQAAKRQQVSRSNRDNSVTREEKRREEINTPVVPKGDDGAEAEVILDAYHSTLPNCQRVEVVNDDRKRKLRKASRMAREVCKAQGWPYDPAEFWGAFFAECATDPWLRGDVPNPNNPNWKQHLGVLLAPEHFAKVMDRAISSMRGDS